MKNLFWQPRISIAIFAMLLLFAATSGILVSSQQKPLTLDNIFAALNPGKTTPKTNTLSKRLILLLGWVKVRQVNFPLTPEIETQLRNVGANNELIETIRRNSPPVKVIPTPTPRVIIKEVLIPPTPTSRQRESTSLPEKLSFSIVDIIQLKDGAIVYGKITGFKEGKINVLIGTGSRKREMTFLSDEIDNLTGVVLELVKIPAGTFMMGSPENENKRDTDEKQHKVTIGKDFYMGKFEVTQAQWKAVMGEENNPSYFKGDNLPVEVSDWKDTKVFISKLSNDSFEFGLPSEAEWEYACRAKTTTAFAIGDGTNLSSNQANFNGNYPYGNAKKGKYLMKPVNVGSYDSNSFGLFDMHGNVYEWCEDIYESDYGKLRADGSANISIGDSSYRVLRGGSWNFDGGDVRSANRFRNSPDFTIASAGFRVVARVK
jgi:formylglycine-generating enzyme required for sulfatase activity